MNKLQRWLSIGAIVFVVFYLGAAVITIQSRINAKERPTKIEAARAVEEERHLMLPQLFLPMGILFTLAVSYLLVKRRNVKTYQRLDDEESETADQKAMSPEDTKTE
jgi:uncharacterized membrane protein